MGEGLSKGNIKASNGGTYVGDGNANHAIPHGLRRKPSRINSLNLTTLGSGVIMIGLPAKVMFNSDASLWDVTEMDVNYFYVGNVADQTKSLNKVGETYYWDAV